MRGEANSAVADIAERVGNGPTADTTGTAGSSCRHHPRSRTGGAIRSSERFGRYSAFISLRSDAPTASRRATSARCTASRRQSRPLFRSQASPQSTTVRPRGGGSVRRSAVEMSWIWLAQGCRLLPAHRGGGHSLVRCGTGQGRASIESFRGPSGWPWSRSGSSAWRSSRLRSPDGSPPPPLQSPS